jgi:hypothetical protein
MTRRTRLVEHFKKRVNYAGLPCSWSSVIQGKTRELGDFIQNPTRQLDFAEPSPILEKEIVAIAPNGDFDS